MSSSSLGRFYSILLGLLALGIAGASLWLCYTLLVYPPPFEHSRLTRLAVAYSVGFLAVATIIFGLRLLIPRLRVENGRIIGWRGVTAFAIVYGLLTLLSLAQGNVQARRTVLIVVLCVALGAALRGTFGRRIP